ncbi:outer membrane protein [Pseudooceanicola sp. HF7]|uniref:outer membrane protein n=1 Tax=Pseudooceanicola sp. HF7 TaxID=2721560 RepID=UPI0014308FAE|nr:outer membrane beta-barrel protein [Pseudooceanicola sp. HF7]NIZ08258.1 porin family protein [Pseudooceanicola sp. HF7]
MTREKRHRSPHLAPVVTAAICATAFATSAAANDSNWTGPYIGGNIGWVLDGPEDGLGKSLHLGYNRQMNNTVIGLELEHSRTDIGTSAGPIDKVYRLKTRAGYAEDQMFYYGVVGLARMEGFFGQEEAYVVGLGVEYDLQNDFSIGTEFLYHGISDFNDSGESLGINTLTVRATWNF